MRRTPFLTFALALGMTSAAWAQSFTYQGSLNDGSGPADGLHNLSFALFDDENAGNQVGGTITQNGFDVVEGLFTAELDFGGGAFNGDDRWLQIAVNGTPLSPRTPITPAPMSMFSMRPWVTSGTSLFYTAGNVGIGTSTPLAKLHVGGGDFRLDGSREIFFADNGQIRSLDNAHRILFRRGENKMELREFGDLIFSPGATAGAETAKVVMAANGNVGIGTAAPQAHLHVAGGELALDDQGTIRGLGRLHIQSNESLFLNPFAGDSYVGFGGGAGNLYAAGNVGIGTSTPRRKLEVNGDIQMSGPRTKLFYKGDLNDSTHTGSMAFYTADGGQTAILTPHDGDGNLLSSSTLSLGGFGAFDSSTVDLQVSGDAYLAGTASMTSFHLPTGAGVNKVLTSDENGVGTWQPAAGEGWSLTGNSGTDPSTDFLGTTDDQPLVLRANNRQAMRYRYAQNTTTAGFEFRGINVLGGSEVNTIGAGVVGATISGGGLDRFTGADFPNSVTADFGTVGGGTNNSAGGRAATVGGGDSNSAGGISVTVAGGFGNIAYNDYATIGGGYGNLSTNLYATVAGGWQNHAWGGYSTVGGGVRNDAGFKGTVGGGSDNTANGDLATVGGGIQNTAAQYGTVGGGSNNSATGQSATVGGGGGNSAGGYGATVPGGLGCSAGGARSFAAGNLAQANHDGAFVWADHVTNSSFASTAHNQFNVRASGGTRIFSNALATTGVLLAPGQGGWSSASDRNLKTNFQTVDTLDVLDQLTTLPLTTWNYKANTAIRHMGAMAQDFHAAFGGLGLDDKHIDTVDADGVAFAAIQGLNRKLEAKNAELEARLERLEAALRNLK